MKKNVGNTDKIIRLLVAATITVLYFTQVISGTLGLVLLAAGAVLALTSLVSFCPMYAALGLNTCPVKRP
jgi:hypothetical protein